VAPNITARRLLVGLVLVLLIAAAGLPYSVSAASLGDALALPRLPDFAASVINGDASVLRGAYAEGLFALPVVQQPSSSAGFVSEADNDLTQFNLAAKYGIVGLLAHNYLSGQDFFQLWPGQRIELVYGDGRIAPYTVTHVYRFQATAPASVYSDFVDLDSGATLSADGLFRKVYTGPKHVTFQTCITQDGNSSWGRLFVVAEPGVMPLPSPSRPGVRLHAAL
jgi:hypothetical protein